MYFYQSVFPEKKRLEHICKIGGLGGNYLFIFTLCGQNYESENFYLKSRLYMPHICGIVKKI